MEKQLFLIPVAVVLLLPLISESNPSYIPAIFIFGDSLFDAGTNHFNKNCSTQADFPPYGSKFFNKPSGRFTNGRTVPDFISQYMGIEFQKPYLEAYTAILNGAAKRYPSNGLNFASAGSGVFRETDEDSGVIPIQEQLLQFQTLVTLNKIDKNLVRNSLIFFESGSNDLFNYYFSEQKLGPEAYVQAMLQEVSKFVSQVYDLGARRIALFSVGPLGCVPAARILLGGSPRRCYGIINVAAKMYNRGLEDLVKSIPNKYPGAVAVFGDVYSLVHKFRIMPQRYGFSNVEAACCGHGEQAFRALARCGKEGSDVCDDPNGYLFWDFFHPSEHTYEHVAKAFWGAPGRHVIRPINLMSLANVTLIK